MGKMNDILMRKYKLNENGFMPTYENFLNEVSYDEQDAAPTSSHRSEDYQAKDDLRLSVAIIDELLGVIGDGEQLDHEQIEIINSVHADLQKLKRSIEGREDLKNKENDKREEDQSAG